MLADTVVLSTPLRFTINWTQRVLLPEGTVLEVATNLPEGMGWWVVVNDDMDDTTREICNTSGVLVRPEDLEG